MENAVIVGGLCSQIVLHIRHDVDQDRLDGSELVGGSVGSFKLHLKIVHEQPKPSGADIGTGIKHHHLVPLDDGLDVEQVDDDGVVGSDHDTGTDINRRRIDLAEVPGVEVIVPQKLHLGEPFGHGSDGAVAVEGGATDVDVQGDHRFKGVVERQRYGHGEVVAVMEVGGELLESSTGDLLGGLVAKPLGYGEDASSPLSHREVSRTDEPDQ